MHLGESYRRSRALTVCRQHKWAHGRLGEEGCGIPMGFQALVEELSGWVEPQLRVCRLHCSEPRLALQTA